jgi:hypothetical protein
VTDPAEAHCSLQLDNPAIPFHFAHVLGRNMAHWLIVMHMSAGGTSQR